MSKLKRIREAKRIRLREIAAAISVTPQTVQLMEQKVGYAR